jgi:ankyrin repeat protein
MGNAQSETTQHNNAQNSNAQNSNAQSANAAVAVELIAAIARDDSDAMWALISNGPKTGTGTGTGPGPGPKRPENVNINVNAPVTQSGATLLHIAAAHDSSKVVRFLLRKGADVEARTAQGHTPLHIAAQKDSEAVATRLLREGGAKIAAVTNTGFTPMHIAAENDAERVAALLMRSGANKRALTALGGETPLHIAVRRGAERVAIMLIAALRAADVDEVDSFGDTPLHLAAQFNAVAVATKLLDAGANVDAVAAPMVKMDDSGHTPLHTAAEHNAQDVAALLIQRGASTKVTSSRKETPIDAATRAGHADMVRVIQRATQRENTRRACRASLRSRNGVGWRVDDAAESATTTTVVASVADAQRHLFTRRRESDDDDDDDDAADNNVITSRLHHLGFTTTHVGDANRDASACESRTDRTRCHASAPACAWNADADACATTTLPRRRFDNVVSGIVDRELVMALYCFLFADRRSEFAVFTYSPLDGRRRSDIDATSIMGEFGVRRRFTQETRDIFARAVADVKAATNDAPVPPNVRSQLAAITIVPLREDVAVADVYDWVHAALADIDATINQHSTQ